ncbi:MAG: hypothetical protein ACI35W_08080 [Anaeroplasmataceae bacterium]
MYRIEGCNEANYELVKGFIENVPSIKNVDYDVLKNASIVVNDDGEALGTLSYEKIGDKALIRYFIFKQKISNDVIYDLFDSTMNKAKEDGIKRMYAIAMDDSIYNLFKTLGFSKVDKEYIYIEENIINDNNSIFLYKMLG